MSTKHTLKLSSVFDMLFHFVEFLYINDSQSYGASNKGVRPSKMGSSLFKAQESDYAVSASMARRFQTPASGN